MRLSVCCREAADLFSAPTRHSCPRVVERQACVSPCAGCNWNWNAMKLTRLRLIGFKSFVEPTDFLIEPGLTGVVGPNGCGKSNLVEALRWVMGETSHKSMRAAEMDDVIFAGNNNRPPRNTAEVAIQIDNAEHEAPAQFNEHDTLDVSRRIEREKGSTLSHQRPRGARPRRDDPVRRRLDRLALARARASGPHRRDHPGQARAAPPRARRGRRHFRPACAPPRGRTAAQGRRNTTSLRVEDVVNQLAGQIDALKRQARQAIRYRNVSAEVRKVEATLYYLRWLGANTEVEGQRARQGPERSRRCRSDDRAIGGRQRPRGRRRRRAAAARSRGARRRGAAAPAHRARHARRRGDPRSRAYGRARPAARAVRGGRRARAHARRRRRSSAGPAWPRKKRRSATKCGPAPSAAPASMPARPRPIASSASRKKPSAN